MLLAFPDVLAQIIPEIGPCVGCPQITPYHCYDVWEHIARTVNAAPPTPTLRWAALLHDIGKPPAHVMTNGRSHFRGHAKLSLEIARRVTQELHMPRAQADAICLLVLHHDDDILLEEKSIRRFVNKLGSVELFYDLCDLKIADSDAHAPDHRLRGAQAQVLKDMLAEMLAAGEPFAVRDLAVNGRDIMALGVEEGPDVGRVLHNLFDGVTDGTLPNDRRALLERASDLVGHSSAVRNAHTSSADASREP